MELLLKILISYFALYIVILFHEWGHSFLYWKYGCKDNWMKVTVKPYLFFSTPRPVDEEKAGELSDKENLLISYGGIISNFIFSILGFILISQFSINNSYINLFIHQFISLNLVEIITYLVLGNIYLVSDMKGIAEINPKLRPVNFFLGVIIAIFYFKYLLELPKNILGIILIFNLIVIICMGLGRIIFTYIYSKK